MFNVAVIDGKKIIKFIIAVVCISVIALLLRQSKKTKFDIGKTIETNVYSHSFVSSMGNTISSIKYVNTNGYTNEVRNNISLADFILSKELAFSNMIVAKNVVDENEIVDTSEENKATELPKDVPTEVTTEIIEEKNLKGTYTNTYNSVAIKNKSGLELTEDMLNPDIQVDGKNGIVIYHTHTCESYTPSDNYNYTMTGTYRTTDLNYNVSRVGDELASCLEYRGYSVIHDKTLHDYPSYSGSYDRSYNTVSNILKSSNAQILLDLHRDAVGNGSDYGPTVKINDEVVAQLMIVLGTNANGLYHPNWTDNLKFAIKLQSKANEMYPGLFRPINICTSRYNQHLGKGAMIIEVGATGNTLDQTLASMKYLASVMDEVLK